MQRIINDIKTGAYQPVYLLFGEERYLKKQYRDKVKTALCDPEDTMNTHFYTGKGISTGEIIDLAETLPFFADRRIIFLENTQLFKGGGEQMAEYLENQNETSLFIFVESEIDKRSKLFKQVQAKGSVIEFAIQDEKILKRWIGNLLTKEGKKITENTVNLFLSKTGTDMENIYMELEKLICYCMDKEVITNEDVEEICTARITNHIFDMVHAIGENNHKQALTLYYDLIALKEPPMRILFLIARHCNILLQIKELKGKGYDNKQIGEKVGIPSFTVNKYLAQATKFKKELLKQAVVKCVEAEESVKTGMMNDTLSVEILIMTVFTSVNSNTNEN